MPKLGNERIIKTYCIFPKYVNGVKYKHKLIYIKQTYVRKFFRPDNTNVFYADTWNNDYITTKSAYKIYKKEGKIINHD